MFERAKQLALAQPPDYAGAHQVLSECCTIDPGNTLFVQALLENLQRARGKTAKAWPWQVWSLQGQLDGSLGEQRYVNALTIGWQLLGERPQDHSILLKLAQVCDALDHQQSQLLLLQAAQYLTANDPAVISALQKALAGAGQFEAASRLGISTLQKPDAALPTSNPDLVAAVEQAIARSQWNAAEKLLAEQSGAEGANLRLREIGEEIMH